MELTQNTISLSEKLEVATTSSNINLLMDLMKDPSMNVRRAVARNKNASSEILSILSYDPVANVSFMAQLNPNCKTARTIDSNHPCVVCYEEEHNLYCTGCEKLINF